MPDDRFEIRAKKKWYGRCRICQRFGRLTKEHVPPEKAFNDRNYFQHYAKKFRQSQRIGWAQRQIQAKGIYVFSLCERCNSKTGSQYGTEYVNFVKALSSVAIPQNANTDVEIELKDFFPMRIIKQAVSMILSTSNPTSFRNHELFRNPLLDAEAFPFISDVQSKLPSRSYQQNIYKELRSFVKKRNAKGLPPSVRLYVHAVANEGTGIRTGIFVHARPKTKKFCCGVAVGLWPIQWILLFQGDLSKDCLEITEWANSDYKDKRSQKLSIPCRWLIGRYPLDFRSLEEFKRDRFVAAMSEEGFIPERAASDDSIFQEAIGFARRRGTRTLNYFISRFKSGTYFEFKGQLGWLDEIPAVDVRKWLEERVAEEKRAS